ncbi:MAG TPA: cytochrome ubiquinol oxidase subunit I [Gemmataceae bacterium]|nr:cytochrome ubiquinol oxidase subunit I [Gemmataceae bacterium]
MDTLTAARAQMGLSLGFHMVFAAFGIGLPLLMVIAEGLWLRTGRPHYLELARKWGKATGLLFAIGAVSGTALSFELGLLWPVFMKFAGAAVGPAFALEGFAFFIEAIFLGLYLYGWDRLSPRAHWLAGIPVAVSGMLSGAIVVAVNAWMQTPVGFERGPHGELVSVDPLAPFRTPSWVHLAVHSTLSCYTAVGFAVAGVYAAGLLRGRRDDYHRAGLTLAMLLGAAAALLMPLSGDLNGRVVAKHQPAKLAAMEALFETRAGAPLLIGGLPDPATGTVRFGLEIPYGLSLLAAHDPNAVIRGLNDFPSDERPDVVWVHLAFQVMVGAGFLLAALGLWFLWAWWRGRVVESRRLLQALLLGSPLGFVALEAGWVVTELGRQPWTVYGVMRTREAVTPAAEVTASLAVFTLLYLGLAAVLVVLLRRLATGGPSGAKGGSHAA